MKSNKSIITKRINNLEKNDTINKNNVLSKINRLLSKITETDNEKADTVRFLKLYLESNGSEINLKRLVEYINS